MMFITSYNPIVVACWVAAVAGFVFPQTKSINNHQHFLLYSEKSDTSTTATNTIYDQITINEKITISDPTPEQRGKGGVKTTSPAKALEVLAKIPSDLIITTSVDDMPIEAIDAISNARNITWATELTAATLTTLHPPVDGNMTTAIKVKQQWISSWDRGGWGSTDDLGPDISEDIVGTLLATGSDNDKNVFAKFRMPSHPGIFKASMGLELLTNCKGEGDEDEEGEDALAALTARGFTYRSMRDALQELVLTSTEREAKGTVRDKRCWDVADTLDRVLSRATNLQLESGDSVGAIVPVHERLSHSLDGNCKLVSIGDEVLLVATRDIEEGEEVTRDYTSAPRMVNDVTKNGSALHLLLQFGLPPSAWPERS